MRVAIDARKLRDGGIGTYVRNLLREFARRPDGNEFVALVAPEDRGAVASGAVTEQIVRAGNYSISEHLVVARAARLAGADLLHAPHYTLPLAWGGPAVVTIHDLTHITHAHLFPPGAALYARVVAGIAARRARIVLTVSELARTHIVSLLGVPEGRVRVTPLAVSGGISRRSPEEVAAFRSERGLPSEYLLFVGALRRHKNVGLLIEALRLLPKSSPPLVLAGGPWAPGSPFSEAARDAGVLDRIVFAGPTRNDQETSLLYSGAALYVHPSISESFNLTTLEAMACGVPVLSSTGGALRESLGDAAAFLPPENPAAWAEAITALLGDEAQRAGLVRRGVERVRSYSWERTAALTLDAYRGALERA